MSLIFHKVNSFLDCVQSGQSSNVKLTLLKAGEVPYLGSDQTLEWTLLIYRIGERTIILISWPLQWAQLSYYAAH